MTTATDTLADAAKRFTADSANHQLTIARDDGLYRHLRARQPEHGWQYWFDIITWPGYLAFVGDGEGYIFTRVEDMFMFFRSNGNQYGINPGYWAEKLCDDSRPSRVKSYSEAKFREHVLETVADAEEDYPGLTDAVKLRIFGDDNIDYDLAYEENAREALNEFEYEGFRFTDTWEWDFQGWDWWFLWACHAIVWAIGQYDQIHARQSAEETPEVTRG